MIRCPHWSPEISPGCWGLRFESLCSPGDSAQSQQEGPWPLRESQLPGPGVKQVPAEQVLLRQVHRTAESLATDSAVENKLRLPAAHPGIHAWSWKAPGLLWVHLPAQGSCIHCPQPGPPPRQPRPSARGVLFACAAVMKGTDSTAPRMNTWAFEVKFEIKMPVVVCSGEGLPG